jgi:hypothetical protein
VIVTRADAKPHPKHPLKHHQQLADLAGDIAIAQTSLWQCQDWMMWPRSYPAQKPWQLPGAVGYRKWVLHLWNHRLGACRAAQHRTQPVVRTLQAGLRGTPMAGSERDLERAGRRWHVSPYFIAGIAATESTLGQAACANNRFNAFGLANCDGRWSVPPFRSWGEAYDFMGRFLKSRWPSARTPWDYSGYAACTACWGNSTAGHMRSLFGVPPVTTY